MKTFNVYYENISTFKQYIFDCKIKDNDKLLIQIFTSYANENKIKNLLSDITSILPNATIIGSTTNGEICEAHVSTGKNVISITQFENTNINSTTVKNRGNSENVGIQLANNLCVDNAKIIISFADGLHGYGEEYLKGISSVETNIVVAGGFAGSKVEFDKTYVFTKDNIISNGAVGVSLSNPNLQINRGYNLNWSPIGRSMTITKVNKNRIYTINNIPTSDIYKKYLGEDIAKEITNIGTKYPLIINRKNGLNIARAVLSKHDDGSLTFGGNFKLNDIVNFGYGDAEMIINQSINNQYFIKDKPVESIFVYSCVARRKFMPDLIYTEIEPYAKLANVSGFFTHGEFFSYENKNEFLNQTMTVLALSESSQVTNKIAEKQKEEIKVNNYQKSIKTLYHILNTTTQELADENKKLEKITNEIKAKEELLQLTQEIGHFGSWEVDFKTKKVLISSECYKIFKENIEKTFTLDTFLHQIIEEDIPKVTKYIENLKDEKVHTQSCMVKRTDGIIINVLLNGKMIFDENDDCIKTIGTVLDITELVNAKTKEKEQNEVIYFQKNYDKLTKLPNRNFLETQLSQLIDSTKQNNTKIALLLIDIDNFKYINDTFGYKFGDQILKTITQRLFTCSDKEIHLFRVGGDEFVIVLDSFKDFNQIYNIATKIINTMKDKITIDRQDSYLTVSIGISLHPQDSNNATELLKYAESAMYKAKEEGRNNYQFYSTNLTTQVFERVFLETSMREAIKDNQFVVYYQPQMDGRNDKVTGMEALVRWIHPTMGLIVPDKFIPLAEETGMIIPLDRYVMEQAMTQFKTWYDSGLNPGVLALNLSIKQLQAEDFLNILINFINEIEFDVKWLELEITESQMMKNPKKSIEILKTISDMGIEIAIDDFGTGYSSLAYLKRLPIDKLKIDKSFIDDLPYNEEDCSISKAVIALANSLNLSLIAEGVETDDQKLFLIQNGCYNIQGYLYSRPIPKDEMTLYLKKH